MHLQKKEHANAISELRRNILGANEKSWKVEEKMNLDGDISESNVGKAREDVIRMKDSGTLNLQLKTQLLHAQLEVVPPKMKETELLESAPNQSQVAHSESELGLRKENAHTDDFVTNTILPLDAVNNLRTQSPVTCHAEQVKTPGENATDHPTACCQFMSYSNSTCDSTASSTNANSHQSTNNFKLAQELVALQNFSLAQEHDVARLTNILARQNELVELLKGQLNCLTQRLQNVTGPDCTIPHKSTHIRHKSAKKSKAEKNERFADQTPELKISERVKQQSNPSSMLTNNQSRLNNIKACKFNCRFFCDRCRSPKVKLARLSESVLHDEYLFSMKADMRSPR
jgi:uncharacterized coiled-coil protein SlyX